MHRWSVQVDATLIGPGQAEAFDTSYILWIDATTGMVALEYRR